MTDWLTPAQAAAYLGGAFKAQAIQIACRTGRLRHVRPGGHRILTTREWVDAWCLASVEGGENYGVQEVRA